MGSIRVAQIAQGYVPALQREGCRNCAQSRRASDSGWPLECKLGGFGTSPYATCQRYERVTDSTKKVQL